MITTESSSLWNAQAGEWQTVTVEVEVTSAPRRRNRARSRRRGQPRDLSGLSDGSPLPAWWRDTAYAPGGPLADLRTYVKPAAMKTRRAATVMPADPGRITARKPSDRLDA